MIDLRRSVSGGDSSKDFVDEVAVDVGEAEVSALVFVGELFVLDAEEVEGGGVEVVDVEGVLGGGEAEGVGLAIGDSAFDSAARHEHGSGFGVVITAAAL